MKVLVERFGLDDDSKYLKSHMKFLIRVPTTTRNFSIPRRFILFIPTEKLEPLEARNLNFSLASPEYSVRSIRSPHRLLFVYTHRPDTLTGTPRNIASVHWEYFVPLPKLMGHSLGRLFRYRLVDDRGLRGLRTVQGGISFCLFGIRLTYA